MTSSRDSAQTQLHRSDIEGRSRERNVYSIRSPSVHVVVPTYYGRATIRSGDRRHVKGPTLRTNPMDAGGDLWVAMEPMIAVVPLFGDDPQQRSCLVLIGSIIAGASALFCVSRIDRSVWGNWRSLQSEDLKKKRTPRNVTSFVNTVKMAAALSLLQQYSQEAISHLPPQAQDVLFNPLAQKAAGALAALLAVNTVNNTLNQWVMNNWTSAGKWDSKRELVLISGGVSGIGKQVMEDLSKAGIRVVVVDINEPNFKLPANVSFYKASVTSSESIAAAAKAIRKAHGDPTVLVNNAGVAYDQTILEEPEEKIRLTYEVNTLSHFLMVREFLPAMIRENHGHVITVASMASFIGMGEMADYCGSKASALAFHESLRQELRSWYKAPKVRTR